MMQSAMDDGSPYKTPTIFGRLFLFLLGLVVDVVVVVKIGSGSLRFGHVCECE
jgi:hypothetical protein